MTTCTINILKTLHRLDDFVDVRELSRILHRPWLESLCKNLDSLTADGLVDNWFIGTERHVALRLPWSVVGKRIEREIIPNSSPSTPTILDSDV